MSFKAPEKYRIRRGEFGTCAEVHGNNGAFFIPTKPGHAPLKVIASDGSGMPEIAPWEHVSVSLPTRCPTWDEMCMVKALFWDDEDCVMQLHPPKSEWISNHSYCLHLWRPVGEEIPSPPSITVGYKELGVLV